MLLCAWRTLLVYVRILIPKISLGVMDKLSQKGNPSYPLLIGSKRSQSDKGVVDMVTNILKWAIVSKGEMLPETRFLIFK